MLMMKRLFCILAVLCFTSSAFPGSLRREYIDDSIYSLGASSPHRAHPFRALRAFSSIFGTVGK